MSYDGPDDLHSSGKVRLGGINPVLNTSSSMFQWCYIEVQQGHQVLFFHTGIATAQWLVHLTDPESSGPNLSLYIAMDKSIVHPSKKAVTATVALWCCVYKQRLGNQKRKCLSVRNKRRRNCRRRTNTPEVNILLGMCNKGLGNVKNRKTLYIVEYCIKKLYLYIFIYFITTSSL